jgi:hypothetical protein
VQALSDRQKFSSEFRLPLSVSSLSLHHWDSEAIARGNKQHFLAFTLSIGHCTLGIKMDLKSIAVFFAMKSLSATAIQAEINNVLGPGTVAYSTVTNYLRKRSFAGPSERPSHVPEIEGADSIDQAILQALDEAPFASLRQLAKRILIPMTIIRYHLVNRMGYKVKHCK